eukprot:984142-Prymnesium_polylepis.1
MLPEAHMNPAERNALFPGARLASPRPHAPWWRRRAYQCFSHSACAAPPARSARCAGAQLSLRLCSTPSRCTAHLAGRSCFPLSPNEDEMSSPASLDQLNVIFSVIGTPN